MIKNLEKKVKAIEDSGPRWAVVVTDARTEVQPPSNTPVASYVDRSGLRFWFLHGNTADDLADAQRAIDQFSRSGIPDLPGARIILRDESGDAVEGSLEDLLAMAELSWAAHVAWEMGLYDRAEKLARELEELSTRV